MKFDIDAARSSGYSDDEIADYLATEKKFDLSGALKSGYSPSEVIGFLSGGEAPASAPVTDTGDETARLAARYKAPEQPGLIERVGNFLKPAPYKSVMEDFQPTPEQNQAGVDRRLSYGAGPISSQAEATADAVRSSRGRPMGFQSTNPTVNKVVKAMDEKGVESFGAKVQRLKEQDPELAADQAATASRRQLAEDSPYVAALGSGAASSLAGAINVPTVAADFLNQSAVNPVLRAFGLPELDRAPKMIGTEYLTKTADDFMPSIGKKSMGASWDRNEFGKWLGVKLAANSTQMMQSLGAALAPPLRAVLLPAMGATAAGSSFVEGDDSRVAVAKGLVEVGTEMLPLKAFDKIGDVLKGMGPSKTSAVTALATQRLLQAGGVITANSLTGAIEESAAQLGGNALDKYFQGKDIELTKGLAEAAVIGAASGGVMSAPQVAGVAAGAYDPQANAARELSAALEGGQFTQSGIATDVANRLRTEGVSENISPAATVANFTPTDSPSAQAGLAPIVVPVPTSQETTDVSATSVPPLETAGSGQQPSDQFGGGVELPGSAVADASGQRGGSAGQLGANVPQAGAVPSPTAQLATGLKRPFDRATDQDLLARTEAAIAAQENNNADTSLQPWAGRSKTGYATEQDADQARATASVVVDTRDTHDWRAEPMGNGRFQLVPYLKSEQQIEQPAPTVGATEEGAGSSQPAQAAPITAPSGKQLISATPRQAIEKITTEITGNDARALVSGKTEKPGGVDPVRQINASEDNQKVLRVGRIPLSMFKPNEEGERYDGTVDIARARDYASRQPEAAPPVIAVLSPRTGLLNIVDGGNRISAARLRGDTEISAIVSLKRETHESPRAAQTPIEPITAPSGKPFSTQQTAAVYAQQNGITGYSTIKMGGGWAIQVPETSRVTQTPQALQGQAQEQAPATGGAASQGLAGGLQPGNAAQAGVPSVAGATALGVSSNARQLAPAQSKLGQLIAAGASEGERAAAVGGPLFNSKVKSAPISVIKIAQKSQLDRYGVEFAPVSSNDLNEQQRAASLMAALNGQTVTFIEHTSGDPQKMPNGLAVQGKHVMLDVKSEDAPLAVAMHEVVHNLPGNIRVPLEAALRNLFKPGMEGDFKKRFGYTDADLDKEIPAMITQAVTKRKDFWNELRQEMGNKDFSAVAELIIKRLDDWVRGVRSVYGDGFVSKYVTDVNQARSLLAKAYAQSMREQGLAPDASVAPSDTEESTKPDTGAPSSTTETPARTVDAQADGETQGLKGKSGRVYQDTRGTGVRLHGTSRTLPEGGPTNDGVYSGSARNIYGQGFYTTDAADIADGYTLKGAGKDPIAYDVQERDGVRLYNMEDPMTDEIRQVAREALGDLYSDTNNETGAPITTLAQAFDEARAESASEGYSVDEVQDRFDSVRYQLEGLGFRGFRHVGGKKTGRTAHDVRIYWFPEDDITVSKTDLSQYELGNDAVQNSFENNNADVMPPQMLRADGVMFSLRQIEQVDDAPEITMQDLVGETVFPILADLTAAGYVYMGKELRGGPYYTLLPSNSKAGLIWANDGKGVASIKNKKAARGVIGLIVAMKQDSHATNNTVANIIFRAVEDEIQKGSVARDDIPKLDDIVRGLSERKTKSKKTGEMEAIFPKFAEFPGFSDRAASEKFLRAMPFEARGLFFEEMTKPTVEDLGLGVVRKVINDTVEPDLRGLNMGDVVMAIRFDPNADTIELGEKTGTPEHDSYRYGVKGEVIGKFKRPISFENVFVDLMTERRAAGKDKPAGNYRSLTLKKPEQKITQEIAALVGSDSYKTFKSPAEAKSAVMSASGGWDVIERPTGAGVKEFLRTARIYGEGKVPSFAEAKMLIKDQRLKIFRLGNTENWFSIESRGDKRVMTHIMVAQPGVRRETLLGDMVYQAKANGATHFEIDGVEAEIQKQERERPVAPIIEELLSMKDADLVNLGISPKQVDLLNGLTEEEGAEEFSATSLLMYSNRAAPDNNGEFDPDNPDIRYSNKAIKRQKLVGTNFEMESSSFVDRKRIKLQDDALRMKRVIEAVKAKGGTVGEAQNFYDANTLMPGRVQAAIDDFKNDVVRPMLDKAAEFGIDMDELSMYAYAKHAKERNAYIASINPRLPDGGSGMTNADADAVIAKAKAEGKESQFEELHQALMGITSATRQVMLSEGLITPDEFTTLEGAYDNYIPLRGFENVDEETAVARPGVGRGVNVRGAETVRAMGRKSKAGDLIENVIRDYERVVARVEKNDVAKVLLDFVLSNPDPDLWGVDVERSKPSFNKAQGTVQYTKSIEKGDDTIGVKVGGQQVYIKFADKELTRALRQAWKDETSGLERATLAMTGWWNNWMRAVLTKYNPAFALINIPRDALWSGTASALAELGPQGLAKYLAVYPKALMASTRQEAGVAGTSNKLFGNPVMDARFKEFRSAGGITGGFFMRTLDDINQELRNELLLAGASARTPWEKVKTLPPFKLAKMTLKMLEFMGAASENATRFALYQASREVGNSPAKAAILAKDGTTNFNRKGEWGGALNNLYLFFNAGVQGTGQLVKVLKSPAVQASMAGVAGVGMMLALYGAAAGGDDDDGEAYWDKIPGHVKERNLVIMLPPGDALAGGIQRAGKRGRYVTIPVQYGFNIFPNTGYVMADVLRNSKDPKRGMTPTKAALHMTSTVFGSVNPFGGSVDVSDGIQVLLAVMPTLADLPVQLATERGTFGTPSSPFKSPWDVRPDSERMFTSQQDSASAKIAEVLNELGDGNKGKAGKILGMETSVAPGTIQTLISATTGGLGTFVEQVGTAVMAMTGDDKDLKANKIPFLNRFYGEVDEGANTQTARERMDKIKKLADEVKAQQKLGLDPKLTKEEDRLMNLSTMQETYQETMSQMRKYELDIIEDQKLTDAEKRLKRRTIEIDRDSLATDMNKQYLKVVPK